MPSRWSERRKRFRAILNGDALMDRAYLAAKRVRICLQGHQPFQAATRAVYETLKALREGTAPKDLPNLASAELMDRVTRANDYANQTRDFLGAKP